MKARIQKSYFETYKIINILHWRVGYRSNNLVRSYQLTRDRDNKVFTWTEYKEQLSAFSYYQDDGSLVIHQKVEPTYCDDIKHKFTDCKIGDTIVGLQPYTSTSGFFDYDKSRPQLDEAELKIQLYER